MNKLKIKDGANSLIFLGWLVYSISYLGKLNYTANITQIIDFYNVTRAEAGIVQTFFFFAYGVGQVVNGILCKKYNIKRVIFISLFLSGVINLILAINTNFAVIKWLWMANGYLLSVLWPTLIRMLSENLPKKYLGKSSIIMGTTVATGTLIIYSLSSIYVAFDKFKFAFYTAAFADIIVAMFWALAYKRVVTKTKKQRDEELHLISEENSADNKAKTNGINMMFATICVLCFCAVGVNLIKDGLITWVPSILKEKGSMPDYMSILLTILLPIVAIAGNAFALIIHRKIPDYIKHCMTLFAVSAVFIGMIIAGFKSVALMLSGLAIVYFLISSLNSLITSVFPMFMREHVNSGKCAGVLDGFCYLGSAISSYGLGLVADHYGWNIVFWCLLSVCIMISMVCGACVFVQYTIKNKKEGDCYENIN